ncbi:unnamed protein product [Urochloa decumbens]|uniref:KIB1-4 beta-propeller domain-containing protein n=1 Tax=Urochloa decumbens TaxID=240449 RepID=A0ABC8W5T9_9POAL
MAAAAVLPPSAPAASPPFLVHDVGAGYYEPQSQYSIAAGQSSLAGWVLALHPASLRAFLWRPEDGERISLPDMSQDFPPNCKCVLSGNPAAGGSSCAVMVLDLDEPEYWLCFVGGANKWERHVYTFTMYDDEDQPVERHMARRHGVAAVGGKVYFEFTGNELGFVEFDATGGEPSYGMIDVDMVDIPERFPLWSSYLVESRGELFLAVVFFDGPNVHKVAEVAVYRMDFSAPAAWRKVDGIGGDRVFLLGGDRIGVSNFGASCAADAERGLNGNRIYFLNHIAINENFLHVIDLEKGTEEVRRPFQEFVDPLCPPFWMLPASSI